MLTDLETSVMLRVFREELSTYQSGLLVHYYGVGEVDRMDIPALARLFVGTEMKIANCIHYALAKLEPMVTARLDQIRGRPSQVHYTPPTPKTDEEEDDDDDGYEEEGSDDE